MLWIRLRRLLSLLWVDPTLVVGWLCASRFRAVDELSKVAGDHVLRAAVSYRGAVHFIRAENNSTPREWTWDRYDAPAAATWNDLYPPADVAWRKFGFAKYSSAVVVAP